jgi:hypothetical protein
MTRFDMIGKGFFILITRECFDLCEQLNDKEIHVIRAFSSKRQALNKAKKDNLPVVEE